MRQGDWQVRTQAPLELGVYPGMQAEQEELLLHVRHLAPQGMHLDLERYSPFAQEVHWVILAGLQLEQEEEHPRQIPFAATKPFRQSVQVVVFEQVMQFLGQLPQVPPMRLAPGGQVRQLVAEVSQVRQLRLQGSQVFAAVR